VLKQEFKPFMKENEPVTVAIATLGCKVNYYDSASMAEALLQDGYRMVLPAAAADVYIINSCTVTERTDAQSRQLIRRALKTNPRAQVIVTGCYAQHSPAAIAALSERIHILGNPEKSAIRSCIKKILEDKKRVFNVTDSKRDTTFSQGFLPRFVNRTRAFLKIQDGCNNSCSYCIVPQVRGPSRSLAPAAVVQHSCALAQAGYKEIVLTGIHLGTYGVDLTPPATLAGLLYRLCSEKTLAAMRIRLSSLEPQEISDELIALLSCSGIVCPHLHIPLQSGDESVLKRMNRNYTPGFFKSLVEKLTSSIPGLNIGVDVIAGFPGETEEQFQNTLRSIQDLPAGYLHVFPYSRRPGTPAAQWGEQVPDIIKKERAALLRVESLRKRRRLYSSFLKQTLQVLIEAKRDYSSGLLKGFSRNYIPVLVAGGEELIGEEITVLVTEVRENGVYGEKI
jgi:threonylcarbamoyladenosine tRNA methylthiotransferase MtaB